MRQTQSVKSRAAKLERWRRFGQEVRSRRLEKGLGLRELAGKVGISPPYLSKVEHGEFPPPAEKRIVAIADHIGVSADVLLALAGKVAKDIRVIITKHPEAWTAFLRSARGLGEEEIRQLARKVGQDVR